MTLLLLHIRRAVWRAFKNGAFATAKAAAYSAILTVFPALLIITWLLSQTHTADAFLAQISVAVGFMIPPGARSTAISYLEDHKARPIKEILGVLLTMLLASSGVMISLMDGFRRAYGVIPNPWPFWKERAVAFFLVFLGVLPMAFALLLVAFGNQIENVMLARLNREIGPYILLIWSSGRWLISGLTSVIVIMLVYHWGLPRVQPWHNVLPGALLATVLWFPVTLTFGWYVTKYATYTRVYGPLGAAIALLVWLYIIAIIILIGAEFNAQAFPRKVAAEMGGKPQ